MIPNYNTPPSMRRNVGVLRRSVESSLHQNRNDPRFGVRPVGMPATTDVVSSVANTRNLVGGEDGGRVEFRIL